MEPVAENDVRFLAVLNASEESSLPQFRWDLARWNYGAIDATAILCELIDTGLIVLGSLSTSSNYSKAESLELARAWIVSDSHDIVLYLTESGWQRWRTEDWGITTERARYLVFSNQRS